VGLEIAKPSVVLEAVAHLAAMVAAVFSVVAEAAASMDAQVDALCTSVVASTASSLAHAVVPQAAVIIEITLMSPMTAVLPKSLHLLARTS
jgi:hypothetical protein